MSLWIAGISLATATVGKGYAGAMAQDVDTEGALGAATNISMAERAQVSNELESKRKTIDANKENLLDMATTKSRKSFYDIFEAKESFGRGNLASSDATKVATDRMSASVYGDHSSVVDKIIDDTRSKKVSIDLNKKKELAGIEQRLQSNIDAVLSTPDTFTEGFFGASDYEVG